ncbi:MAG: hypothetical protein R2729_24060 [Bryobacteraceae bacterium]
MDDLGRAAGGEDGFEGNAQSFRIVASIAVSDARDGEGQAIKGLNLTRRTLNGILKYPWAHGTRGRSKNKWGFYSTEKDIFEWVRTSTPAGARSLIAEIMDWADDITFAIHDLLDFYCAGRVPIDRCKGEQSGERSHLTKGMFQRKVQWLREKAHYENALTEIIQWFPFEPDQRYTGSFEDRAKLYDFSTVLIRMLTSTRAIRLEGATRSVIVDTDARRLVEVLKQFIWEYVIENPDLAVPQNGQRVAVRRVFQELLDASSAKRFYLFPTQYQETISKATKSEYRVRIVADCVSGMTEKELIGFYRRLLGHA